MSETIPAEADHQLTTAIDEIQAASKRNQATVRIADSDRSRFHVTFPLANRDSRNICKIAASQGFAGVDVWSLTKDLESGLVTIAFEPLARIPEADDYEPFWGLVARDAIREVNELTSIEGEISAGMDCDGGMIVKMPCYNVNPRVCRILLTHGFQLRRVYKPLCTDGEMSLQFKP